MTRAQVAGGAITVVVVAVAAGVVVGGVHYHGGKPDVTIELSMDPQTKQCTARDPERAGGAKGTKVTWTVVNKDCGPQYIQLKNFHEDSQGPDASVVDPIPVAPKASDVPIATGTPVNMDAKINKKGGFIFDDVYKYEIWIGDTPTLHLALDPDIDVWP